jgi:rubrerythrin
MKKIFSQYYLIGSAVILCFVACDNNRAQPEKMTTEQHMATEKKTVQNMHAAYAKEITGTAKYEAFSKQAEKDGYHSIALLYNAIVASEGIHAINHKIVIEDAGETVSFIKPEFTAKTTKENLNSDIHSETHEAYDIYPEFLKTAKQAGSQIAILSLNYAMNGEKKHKFFFEQALGDINSNTLNSLPHTYFVCSFCGNIYTSPPKHCDFCLTERSKFIKFN